MAKNNPICSVDAGRARQRVARTITRYLYAFSKDIVEECKIDCLTIHFHLHPTRKSYKDKDLERIVDGIRKDYTEIAENFISEQWHYYRGDKNE